MTEKEFAYWLHGFIEITGGSQVPTKEQHTHTNPPYGPIVDTGINWPIDPYRATC